LTKEHRRRRRGELFGQNVIIRALNYGEDLFLKTTHPNPIRKKGKIVVRLDIFWFEQFELFFYKNQ